MTQIDELVKRLRDFRPVYGWPEEYATAVTQSLGDAAADALEAQAARVKELETALEPFSKLRAERLMTDGCRYDYRIDVAWIRRARALMSALRNAEGEKDGE